MTFQESELPDLSRLLPSDLESEQAIIGSAILDPSGIAIAAEEIPDPSPFYLESNRCIYSAMLELHRSGSSIDIVLLVSKLRDSGSLEKAGGAAYVSSMTSGMSRCANMRHYCGLVREKWILRRTIQLSQELMSSAFNGVENSAALLDKAQDEILKLYPRYRGSFVGMSEVARAGYRELSDRSDPKVRSTWIRTGLVDLDGIIGAIRPGNFVVIGARPSQGKSALCHQIALHAAKQGRKIGIVTLEMSATEVYDRMVSGITGIDLFRLSHGKVKPEEWNHIRAGSAELSDLQIHIADVGESTIGALRSKCWRLWIEKGVDLIIVDYLGLMQGVGGGKISRVQEVSEITRGMKAMAKEMKIPVIAACQLNRDAADKIPQLHELRESGSIEQDADLVLLIYRSDMNSAESTIEVAKHRNGPTGSVNLVFEARCTRFIDKARSVER